MEIIMGLYDKRPCPCGSGKMSQWLVDARGIPVSRVCPDCEHIKMAKYKSKIFTDSNYTTEEPIEPDDNDDEILPETENAIHRRYGYHDIANKHTRTVNHKKNSRYKSSYDDDELRKKKSSKTKSKRKPKKIVKKCKCK